NVARHIAGNRDLQGSYGRLGDGNANHSVLLIRIGDLTFAEWSHNGKLRAWPNDSKNVPALFRAKYFRSELIASCLRFPAPAGRPDLGPRQDDGLTRHAGIWQGRVAALLQQHEGIRLQARDWQA